MQFTELPLTDSLLEGLDAMNFKETTPVQEQAIPIILKGKDVIACAQTGTGKTAAFLLPLLNNLLTDNHENHKVNAIIMAPTRELAQQIDQMMEGFSYYTPFSSVAVYGGNDGDAWETQKKGLQNGAEVVIATPGRLLSHINLYNIDFSGVKYFILDEADRMLDMGFYDDIMKIVNLLPAERQTVMFSATMPPKIQQMAKTILTDPEEISIAVAKPPESIIQSAYICYESQKIEILKLLFKNKKPNKVILFSGKKQKVKEIAKTLHNLKLSVGEMHSDLDQAQREHVMHEFKNERVDILVATDIVSRGIDIDDITLVINFDVPYDVEDYVHRIGRTARAGDSGMAITFVIPHEQYLFEQIESFLQKEIYRIPVPAELGEAPEYNPVKFKGQKGSKRTTSRKKDNTKTGERSKKVRQEKTSKPEKSASKSDNRTLNIENESTKNENRPTKDKTRTPKSEKIKGGEKKRNERPQRNENKKSTHNVEVMEPGENKDQNKDINARNRNRNNKNRKQGLKSGDEQQAASKPQETLKSEGALKPGTEGTKASKGKKLVKKKREKSNIEVTATKKETVTSKKETHKKSAEAGKQSLDTGKKKKWSWWPFGKK